MAITIGRVMEEAGNKIESDIEDIKSEYVDKIKCLENTIKRLITTNETDAKKLQTFDGRVKSLEGQLEQSHQINSKLDQELQIASKTIVSFLVKSN